MIYILRHGLDDEKFIGGWSEVELVPEGIEQVKKTIAFMKNEQIKFDKIYSSDIKRAKQTALLVAQEFYREPILDSRFRELDKGDLTGLDKVEAEMLYPDYIHNVAIDTRYPNGESMVDMYKRQKEVLEWLLEQDNILIVTHRGPINMYYFALNEIPLSNDKKRFGVKHATLHELDPKQKVLRKIYDPKESRK